MPKILRIKVNPRIKIEECNSDAQCCVYCGRVIGRGTIAINMNNSSDGISLRKNLWLHLQCAGKLGPAIKKKYKECEGEIILHSL